MPILANDSIGALTDVHGFAAEPTRLLPDTRTLADVLAPGVAASDVSDLPFLVSDRLLRRTERYRVHDKSGMRMRPFEVAGRGFTLVEYLPVDVYNRYVKLAGHQVAVNSDEAELRLASALGLIGTVSPSDLDLVAAFCPNWIFLELRSGTDARLITSCSLPDLPFLSFVSSMAWRHIPPRSIAADPSDYFAAENLVHEAVHQMVNFQLLSQPVLSPDYHSATSPRIDIPWRADASEARNRTWEVDRALHAASVYAHLVVWRRKLLHSGALKRSVADVYSRALDEACRSLDVLIVGLRRNTDAFTPYGAMLLGLLCNEVHHRSIAAQLLLKNRPLNERGALSSPQ